MDYYDEHDEDDLPEISLSTSHYTRKISNDNDEQEDKSLENWRNLYEASIHSLQSDEEDIQTPLYFEPQTSIEQPPSNITSIEQPPSNITTIEQPPSNITSIEQLPNERPNSSIDSNTNKSKWEIRLPELLNSMVGPDRQQRDISRRHTTDIVFQQSGDSNPYSLETEVNKPRNPLVKQLKQKFDQMIMANTTIDDSTNHLQIKKLQRVGSLTCRGLTANTRQRVIPKSRPSLPIRPTPEITPVKSPSGSNGSKNSQMTITNKRDKPGPPVSYPKHYYPPPSTASVVKQLIGGGATLIYDSKTQKSTSTTKPSIIKHQRSVEQTKEDLKNTNTVLLGRQLSSDYAKIKKPFKSTEDESDENYYEPILGQTTYNSSRSISLEVPNGRRNPNANERRNHYPVYDMNIKK